MNEKDMKKWLTEQISYSEKTKEQPEKFAWDPEYDLQLAAFRLALERLEPVGPLTLEQLQEMNGEPVWITSVKKDGKIPSRWVLYSGKSESRDREDVYVFATTGGIAQGYKGAAYGKTWLAYAYPPANIAKDNNVSTNAAHIDREAWEPCERCKPEEKPLDRFSGHEFIIDGADIYFYDTDDGWEGEEIKFCSWCGRPLTPEAWAEMEKRLRG